MHDNYLRVENLDYDAARDAIKKPVELYNGHVASDGDQVTIEPELVEAIGFIGQARAEVDRLEIADTQRSVEALASYLRALLSSNEFIFVE